MIHTHKFLSWLFKYHYPSLHCIYAEALMYMKTKVRNRMNVENDMRLALPSTRLQNPWSAANLQGQPSH